MYFYESMSKKNFIRRIISSPIVQAFLIYLSGGWIALEMTDYFISKYDLSEKISEILSIILLIGLPIVIFLAWYLGREKDGGMEIDSEKKPDQKTQGFIRYLMKKSWFSIPGAVVILLLFMTGIRFIYLQGKKKWAREQALPQMQNMMHDWDHVNAFQLARQVVNYIPDDPEFIRIDSLITARITILTDPEGVDVYFKHYPDVEDEWISLGTTPLSQLAMPNRTMYRWKFEKPGYEDVYAVSSTFEDTIYRTMHESGNIPDGMVYVEGVYTEPGWDFDAEGMNGFFIDRYEVSNRQFKDFIESGGYRNPEFWQHEFIRENEILDFEGALEFMIDLTGRPGPATWEAGDFPEGQENYPVNGISWYEAAAYAQYAGKSLPTLSHWRGSAGLGYPGYRYSLGSNLIPLSNMEGKSLEPVGSNPGLSSFGTYDMFGNVREWCFNASPSGRIIQGGAWNDVTYMSTNISQVPPFDRSPKNGFRCVIFPDGDKVPDKFIMPISLGTPRDYYTEEPVSALEFKIFRKQFLYDKTALNSRIEDRDETPADWIIEKVSFDAAYEQERMLAYLFLPKNVDPPYQTLVHFPGSSDRSTESIFEYRTTSRNLNYILKNGRAVIYPIYKGTYERRGSTCSQITSYESHQYTDCLVKWIKDFSRSIDYLETREDIDTASLGYLGDSWGARLGAIIPAVEERIKLSILLRGGFSLISRFPEADEFNYISHVTIPVLMLNGEYDFTFPYESSVKPMFDLVSTPEEDKKLVLSNTDHFIPRTQMIKEVLEWLDIYFGPVNK